MQTVALILAGGESKRFAPLVTGKPLFPFFSKPLIQYTAESLSEAGFTNLVVVTTRSDFLPVKKALSTLKAEVKLVVQKEPTGMADGVLAAAGLLQNRSVLVVNAADLVDPELIRKAFLKTGQGKNFIVARKQPTYFDGGYLAFSNGKLTGIVEKPGAGKQPSDLTSLVFDYFHSASDFLKLLQTEKSPKDDRFERALSRLIKQSEVGVIEYRGYWQPLKYPWHVLDMAQTFLRFRLKPQNLSLSIAPSATVDDNVFLGKGVRVLDHAVIKGPSYIGDNTIIGTNSLVIESHIEAGCVVGYSSEVTRSYLGSGVWLHRNYLGDSVLEGDNHLGAGAVTANFRLDEGCISSVVVGSKINTQKNKFGAIMAKHSRLGVNSSLMPGVKIGENSNIGPGVVLYADLPSDTAIFLHKKSFTSRPLKQLKPNKQKPK